MKNLKKGKKISDRLKHFWGLFLLTLGFGLIILFFCFKNIVPSGPLFDFINSLFPGSINSPGQEQRIILRAAKLWQIVFLLPGIVFTCIGSSMVLFWDSRRLLRRIIGFLPTPIFLTLCSVLFFAGAVWVAEVPLEGIPHTGDDITQIFQARILARGHLLAPAPVPTLLPSFLSIHIIVQNGFWHGMYPIGHSLLLVPFIWLKQEMLAGALFGVLRILLIYALARLFLSRNRSRLTAILCTLSPFGYLISASPVYHNTDIILTMIFLWGFWHSRQYLSWFPLFLAGLSLGYSAIVRPILPCILGASAITLLLWDLWHDQRRDALWRGTWLAIATIPGVLLLFWTNYVQNGSPLLLGYEILSPGGQFLGFGDDKTIVALYGSIGHTPLKALYNLMGNLLALSTTLHGWPLISLFPALLGLCVGRKKMFNWFLAAICLYTAIIQFFHMGSSIALGPRHYFICVPSLLILGAQGMVWLFNKGKEYALATSLTLVFLTIQAAIIYVPSVISDLKNSYLSVDSKVTRISERETLKPALVFIRSDIKGYYNSQSGFLANSPWLDDKIIYAQELDSEQNQRVIAAYPDRHPYVFICPSLDDPGMLYPFKDAPTPKPGDVTLFNTLSSSKNPAYLLK